MKKEKNRMNTFEAQQFPTYNNIQHLEPGDHAQRMDLCHWVQTHPEL
jgi:hypothetical protein